jgi:stearoyl-CoA desaturase (delta-9 desaturase)
MHGILDLSLLGHVLATLLLTHVTIIAVTVYLHRHQAHRALDLHPALAHFFRFWLWLTTGMVTREWVAVHRKHHARVETPEDPHSPHWLGIRKVLLEGAEVYGAAAEDPELVARYAHGAPDDWIDRNLYRRFRNVGISLMLVIDLLLFGVAGLAVWAVQMLWIPFFAAGVINGLGHWWGYRNFDSDDAATNILPWGVLIGGEELHNNHHAYASSAKLSARPWELDIGWGYIRIFSALGLARVRRLPPRAVEVPGKELDLETVRAVAGNRLHVLSEYARRVVGQVYRDELGRASGAWRYTLKQARRVLVRHGPAAGRGQSERRAVDEVLAGSQALRVVMEHRERLMAIWRERTASQERLAQALQEWCRQAEETGIQSLAEFARSLRSWSLQPRAA